MRLYWGQGWRCVHSLILQTFEPFIVCQGIIKIPYRSASKSTWTENGESGHGNGRGDAKAPQNKDLTIFWPSWGGKWRGKYGRTVVSGAEPSRGVLWALATAPGLRWGFCYKSTILWPGPGVNKGSATTRVQTPRAQWSARKIEVHPPKEF